MKQVIIYDRNGWRVTSFGNGTAYVLEHLSAAGLKVATFQGEDALTFETDTMSEGWFLDNCEDRFADYSEIMEVMQR